MSDTINDAEPIDPPVSTGGGGGTAPNEAGEGDDGQPLAIDPPVSTGGGGGA